MEDEAGSKSMGDGFLGIISQSFAFWMFFCLETLFSEDFAFWWWNWWAYTCPFIPNTVSRLRVVDERKSSCGTEGNREAKGKDSCETMTIRALSVTNSFCGFYPILVHVNRFCSLTSACLLTMFKRSIVCEALFL